jgi:hypothetical protein
MSIQWQDDFQSYGPVNTNQTGVNILQGTPYSYLAGGGTNRLVQADPVVSGGFCLQCTGNNSNSTDGDNNIALPVPATGTGLAFRYYTPSIPSGGERPSLVMWRDLSNTRLLHLVLEANGALSLYPTTENSNTNPPGIQYFASTIVPVITSGAWWHIEAFINFALQTYNVYVEGVSVLSGTLPASTWPSTQLTANIGWSPRQPLSSNTGSGQMMKDLIVYDNNGSVNNAAGSIGPVTVYRLPLNTDISNGWTITGGSTVNGTIGVATPNDSNFISAGYSPFPAPAICGITSLPNNIVGVRAVMSLQRVSKSDGGDASYQMDFISGSNTHTGVTHNPPAGSFTYQYDVVELDPATGSLWSPIAVNNSNIGINRTV